MKKNQKIVCVKWMDACAFSKVDRKEVCDISPKDLLVYTETYGIILKEDDVAITILQEDSTEQIDATVIPKVLIIKDNFKKK